MSSNIQPEIDSCIRELNAIVRELEAISDELKESITGINTVRFTKGLEYSAGKYQKAARTLSMIR